MLSIVPSNGITFHYSNALEDSRTLMINNFVVHGRHGIGIGRKVYEEWEGNIPENYNRILLRAKNDKALAFWTKMGFTIENGPNAEGEHWMVKDISMLERDARIPFLYTTRVKVEEALYETRRLGTSNKTEQEAALWLETAEAQSIDELGHSRSRFADAPKPDVLVAAIRAFPAWLKYLKHGVSETLQITAANHNGYCLWTLDEPSDDVVLTAVKSQPSAIEYVANRTPLLQFIALTQGFPKHEFDSDILAELDECFDNETLERVRPGLSAIRALMHDADVNSKVLAYEQLMCGELVENSTAQLPDNLSDNCHTAYWR